VDSEHHMLGSGMTARHVLTHPADLLEPENAEGFAFVTRCAITFVGPSAMALFFLKRCDNLEHELIPLSTMYQGAWDSAHEHMGESLVVSESIAEEILDGGVMVDVLQCGKSPTDTETNEQEQDVWEVFRGQLMAHDNTHFIQQDKRTWHAKMTEKVSLVGKVSPSSLYNSFNRPWWPLGILLKPDMSEEDPFEFRKILWAHSTLCLLLLLVEVYAHVALQLQYSEGEGTLALQQAATHNMHVHASIDCQWAFHMCCMVLYPVYAVALLACAKKVYSLWPCADVPGDKM